MSSRRRGLESLLFSRSMAARQRRAENIAAGAEVRHPPQNGWLDEWGRLKGGHPLV